MSSYGRTYDAIVIGGGIVGAACADALAGSGLSVAIVEGDFALVEGEIAGLAAAGFPDEALRVLPKRSKQRRFAARLASTFSIRPEIRTVVNAQTIVCRCEDVRHGQLEGQRTWRGTKFLTRCGMGACQGRICGTACEFLCGWSANSRRLPVQPARVSSLIEESSDDAENAVGSTLFQLREESK